MLICRAKRSCLANDIASKGCLWILSGNLFKVATCSITAQYLTKVRDSPGFLPYVDSLSGGIVLWSRSFTPDASNLASSSASPVNSLIREALIEGRTTDEKYEKDGYAVKWTFVNDLELIFVVCPALLRPQFSTYAAIRGPGGLPAHPPTDLCGRPSGGPENPVCKNVPALPGDICRVAPRYQQRESDGRRSRERIQLCGCL